MTRRLMAPPPSGVPVNAPKRESDNPAGSGVSEDHVYGGVPPSTSKIVPYLCPAVAGGRGHAVVTLSTGAPTSREHACTDCLPAPSVTRVPQLATPLRSGVPDSRPAASRVRPPGSSPTADHR